MKIKSRYVYYPATRKIHRNPPTLADRIRKWFRKREAPDVFPIVDYYPAVYPTKNERSWENERSGITDLKGLKNGSSHFNTTP